ncbi:MAG: transcription antitermination factor NusB [Pseudomonadota bacterium]
MRAEPSARAVALDLLAAVHDRRHALDDALETQRDLKLLSTRDPRLRAPAGRDLSAAARQLDAAIDAWSAPSAGARPTSSAPHPAARRGCSSCSWTHPAHAAVDGAVGLADHGPAHALKGLINAVLRRLAREGRAMVTAQDVARLNLPGWSRGRRAMARHRSARPPRFSRRIRRST